MSGFSGTLKGVLSLLMLLAVTAACVTERSPGFSNFQDSARIYTDDQVRRFSPLESRYNLDPLMEEEEFLSSEGELSEVYDPFAKYAAQTYRSFDGVITRHYYLEPGKGQSVADLLIAHVQGLSFYREAVLYGDPKVAFKTIFSSEKDKEMKANQVLVINNAVRDLRPTAMYGGGGFSQLPHATDHALDLMIVTAEDQDKLMEVDAFLTSLLNELPQVEIKVRVVEVAVTDQWEWGTDNLITPLTSSSKAFLKEWFNFYNSESFGKAAGLDSFQGTLFNALGVQDHLQLEATFQLLQRITDSDILTAPTLTVLNGHRAILETGEQVPQQSITSTPTAAFYSYKYTQTGVKLTIVPYVLPGNLIEVYLTVEVSAETGRETFQTSIGPLSQPVISKRSACTRLRIKEGQAFALGGLMGTKEFQTVTKLPLMGDIPILGYLFKTKSVEKAQSQIIFYVEPHVVKRDYGWKKRTGE